MTSWKDRLINSVVSLAMGVTWQVILLPMLVAIAGWATANWLNLPQVWQERLTWMAVGIVFTLFWVQIVLWITNSRKERKELSRLQKQLLVDLIINSAGSDLYMNVASRLKRLFQVHEYRVNFARADLERRGLLEYSEMCVTLTNSGWQVAEGLHQRGITPYSDGNS